MTGQKISDSGNLPLWGVGSALDEFADEVR